MSYLNMAAPYQSGAPPSPKRQKTPTGYATTPQAYNSDDDDGDAIFENYVPDTPQGAFETQPTQIIDRTAPPHAQSTPIPAGSIVQVPASSPFTGRDNSPTPLKPTYNSPHFAPKPTTNAAAYMSNKSQPSTVAMSMAPAGTAYKAPNGIQPKPVPTTINLIDDDDEIPEPVSMVDLFGSDSEEDETASRANIKPSTFTSGPSKFQSIIANSSYDGARSSGYGMQQSRPERAMPVGSGTWSSNDTTDDKLREGISKVRSIFPSVSVHKARALIVECNGNWEEAIERLMPEDSSRDKRATSKSQPIVIDDDESSNQPQFKHTLSGPTKSLRDKYSTSTQQPSRIADDMSAPPKPKRKLMQGRRNGSPGPVSSPAKPKLPSPTPVVHDEFDTDSGIEESSEDDPELEGQCLKFFNTSSLKDLVELTNTSKEFAEAVIAARPFKTLDRAREVENPKLTKAGKKSKRAAIGAKIVETAMEMMRGYEAVDALVAACGEIAKPIRAEMSSWGIKIHGHGLVGEGAGELEMTSFDEDDRDSGLGTPSTASSPKGGDDDIKSIARNRFNYLKKPKIMADDCILKDYQVVGLNWLAMMYRQEISCILADEMGLGKTCQVIAFLSHLVETGNNGPHLVICPGSTLENWLREINRFAPNLSVEPYHGAAKDRPEIAEQILGNRQNINVVVTTYDMAAKPLDNQFMRRLKADVCVYDEGHMLKNPKSLRYSQLVKIPSKLRLLLTGTPLQNNLQELAALLAFIMPKVFKEREEDLSLIFKSKATTKDADHAALLSAQRIARAKSMLTPFVLRRKKDQVLKHLPAKTCRVQYVDIHPAQKKIYDGHLDQARERAQAKVDGTKVPKDKNDENNPLMQLRKAAIHPLLFRRHFSDKRIEKMTDILRDREPENFNPDSKRQFLVDEMKAFNDYELHRWCLSSPCIKQFDVPDLSWMNSGKVSALVKLLQEYKKNGDRVLIFSQFSLVLDILEAVFYTTKVQFIRIDGSTNIGERQPLIDTFRDNEDITAFLLTTKAGGTGINLMYANKVIIFDGSFNPQDDRQAENRAHRVGQTREVEVVRLVTRGTIEEQIYALGQSKLMLDGRVAGEKEGDEDAAGEKAVAAMLLNGTGMTSAEGDEEKEEQKPPSTLRKQSTLLGMATQSSQKEKNAVPSRKRKSEDEDDTSPVKRKKES